MAGWLEEQLTGYQGAQNALMAASTGGAQAPAQAAPGAAQAPPRDPLAALIEGAMQWQKKHGRDPLQQNLGGIRFDGRRQTEQPDPVRLLTQAGATGLNAAGSVTTHGPRAGMAKQAYDLGDGRVAHVYFDEKGKRQVQVFRKPQGPAVSP